MNMITDQAEIQIANLLKVMGSPFRIQILYSIGFGEACVCHLEAVLKRRQAYISQHLMILRDAGILETRREGKYIYYRVADKNVFGLIQSAAVLLNLPKDHLPDISEEQKLIQCECPNCN